MLTKLNPQQFDEVYRIMEESFPPEEIRGYAGQKALLERGEYQIYCLTEPKGGTICAFITVYEFDTFLFAEHFAVSPQYRNGGLGAKMLEALKREAQKPIVLEVEPPEGEMPRRRIGFYERNGFYFNRYEYIQPPIEEGKPPIPLFLMTTCPPLSPEAFEATKCEIHERVYGVKS